MYVAKIDYHYGDETPFSRSQVHTDETNDVFYAHVLGMVIGMVRGGAILDNVNAGESL